ncbi:ABC transporter permease [Brevibacillus sp. HB1.2]|uniref:ABC transporter permease n=1 Tax=Brevibacillus TaxID=55080 RepID=UPI00037A7E0E|nr:ABC transporter permease [Brevibacillus sp. AG]ATF15717.1 ABC transporter permease [Brevibacillus brevis X23]NRS19532.1 ABC transporter permease [Brevibacillus sp. HB1.4B]NTU22390.1 ABC transporter permease [Brevibacillus sp. HB1.2]NTU33303.1 ABC transporter permease [Brevibacillus sp. HB1.1]MDC0764004.1 ABC transporter permease [Brevibacillus sp. AG]
MFWSKQWSMPRLELWEKIMQQKKAKYSFLMMLCIVLLGIIGPWIAPHDPTKTYYEAFMQGPSKDFWLGTDAIGRDILSRMLYGTRVTLTVAVLASVMTFVAGTLIGVTCAYLGGIVDNLIMRIMDIMLALPGIVLALAIVAVLGPSQENAMIAIGISSIPAFSILIRGAALSIKQSGYVEASRSIGSSNWWIITRQFIPNISNVLIVYTTMFIGSAILGTSALGFIGLGAQPPTPEWGTMLNEGKNYLREAWWLATFPGLAITAVVFTVYLLGDALRDIFDPKS